MDAETTKIAANLLLLSRKEFVLAATAVGTVAFVAYQTGRERQRRFVERMYAFKK